MVATDADVIGRGRERARAGPWRGDRQVAYLVPLPNAPAPSAAFVEWAMEELAGRGFVRVVTNALPLTQQGGFLRAGFDVQAQLHVLGRDLRHMPPASPLELRTGHRRDHAGVLELDSRAFAGLWRLDEEGLADAIGATPRTRLRLVGDGFPLGYALTGRAGRRGFLQRLAVDPDHRRRGVGRALVVDALRWLRRWRVERVVVNTPHGNEPALALYESLGFRREPAGLSVLSAGLQR
jgi:ribosomal protein S18 acetylase RimI-like enzyme